MPSAFFVVRAIVNDAGKHRATGTLIVSQRT